MKKSEVFKIVKDVLNDSLGIEDDMEILLESRIIDDLGAESIDFLDITARLERRFDVSLDTGDEVETLIRDLVSEEELETGVLPKEVLEKLPELMKEIDPSEFKEGLRLNDIPRLYTVDSLIIGLEGSLAENKNIIIENDM